MRNVENGQADFKDFAVQKTSVILFIYKYSCAYASTAKFQGYLTHFNAKF